MRSSQFLPFLSPICLAVPFTTHRGYSTLTTELHEDLQQEWYSNYNGTEEITTISTKQTKVDVPEAPSDPTAVYSCVGPKAEDFPGKDEWLNFTQLWNINEPVIETANEGNEYNEYLKTAILEVASESKIDARLILSIIMQEV